MAVQKVVIFTGGSPRGMNTETCMRSGWLDEDYLRLVGNEIKLFAVSKTESKMTVREALIENEMHPGRVGTVESVL